MCRLPVSTAFIKSHSGVLAFCLYRTHSRSCIQLLLLLLLLGDAHALSACNLNATYGRPRLLKPIYKEFHVKFHNVKLGHLQLIRLERNFN